MADQKRKQTSMPGQPIAGMRPGGPNNPDPGYTPGANAVGPAPGVENAGDLTGGGTGGDIDLPDLTGRGSTRDLTRPDSPDLATPPASGPTTASQSRNHKEEHHGRS